MSLLALYFSARGRVSRRVVWLGGVIPFGSLIAAATLLDSELQLDGDLLLAVAGVLACPSLAIQAKRWHDRNRTGWWALLLTVLIGVPWTLYAQFDVPPSTFWILLAATIVVLPWPLIELCFLSGHRGANRFGNDPLAGTLSDLDAVSVDQIDLIIGPTSLDNSPPTPPLRNNQPAPAPPPLLPESPVGWVLAGQDPEGEPYRFELDRQSLKNSGGSLIIGRGSGAHLVLPNTSVSREHAILHLIDGTLKIQDHDSTAGTFLNGQRLSIQERTRIHPGDEVEFGEVKLRLQEA